jgi:replicative DNA helicase
MRSATDANDAKFGIAAEWCLFQMALETRRTKVIEDNKPIFDEESERALLGCILLKPEQSLFVTNKLQFIPEMFYVHAHQTIYQTMLALELKHIPIEPIALFERLNAKGHGEEVGGSEYIVALMQAPVTTSYAEHYAGRVLEKYKLRHIADYGRNIRDYIAEGLTADEISAKIMIELMSKSDFAPKKDVKQIQEGSMQRAKVTHDGGVRPGHPSFFDPLNRILGSYLPKMVYVVAGTTSNGKSTFVINEILHKSVVLGVPCVLISMEMSEDFIRQIMAATLAGVDAFKFFIFGNYTPEEADAVRLAYEKLLAAPIFIIDHRMTIEQLVSRLSFLVKKFGVKFVSVDYLQLLRYSQGRQQMSRNEQVMEWSAALKEHAVQSDYSLLLVSQLSRSGVKSRELTPPPPATEALRDSGCIEQDADGIIFIYKKPGEPYESFVTEWDMEIDVAKHRWGPVGTVKAIFQRNRQRFVVPGSLNEPQHKLALGERDDEPKSDPY